MSTAKFKAGDTIRLQEGKVWTFLPITSENSIITSDTSFTVLTDLTDGVYTIATNNTVRDERMTLSETKAEDFIHCPQWRPGPRLLNAQDTEVLDKKVHATSKFQIGDDIHVMEGKTWSIKYPHQEFLIPPDLKLTVVDIKPYGAYGVHIEGAKCRYEIPASQIEKFELWEAQRHTARFQINDEIRVIDDTYWTAFKRTNKLIVVGFSTIGYKLTMEGEKHVFEIPATMIDDFELWSTPARFKTGDEIRVKDNGTWIIFTTEDKLVVRSVKAGCIYMVAFEGKETEFAVSADKIDQFEAWSKPPTELQKQVNLKLHYELGFPNLHPGKEVKLLPIANLAMDPELYNHLYFPEQYPLPTGDDCKAITESGLRHLNRMKIDDNVLSLLSHDINPDPSIPPFALVDPEFITKYEPGDKLKVRSNNYFTQFTTEHVLEVRAQHYNMHMVSIGVSSKLYMIPDALLCNFTKVSE